MQMLVKTKKCIRIAHVFVRLNTRYEPTYVLLLIKLVHRPELRDITNWVQVVRKRQIRWIWQWPIPVRLTWKRHCACRNILTVVVVRQLKKHIGGTIVIGALAIRLINSSRSISGQQIMKHAQLCKLATNI